MRRDENRSGFTLVELLVAIAIMALLMTLAAGALFKSLETVNHGAAVRTIEKVYARLDRRIKHLYKEADKRTPSVYGMENIVDSYSPAPVHPLVMANGLEDREYRRAKVIYFKYLMKWNFPMSYDEVRRNVRVNSTTGAVYGHPIAVALYTALNDRLPVTNKAGIWRANNVDPATGHYSFTESAACLALILQLLGTLDDFTSRELKDTDGDGIPEIVDAWDRPLRLYRWPKGYVDLLGAPSPEYPVANPAVPPNNRMHIALPPQKWFADGEDPDSVLYIDDDIYNSGSDMTNPADSRDPDRVWLTATTPADFRNQFELAFHKLVRRRPDRPVVMLFRPIYTPLVIASAGPGKRWGLGYYNPNDPYDEATVTPTPPAFRVPDPWMRVFRPSLSNTTGNRTDAYWLTFDQNPVNAQLPRIPDGDLADDEFDNIYSFRLGLAVSGQ